MARDFDNIGHKNIELLRFYINKDLKKIDKKLSASNDNFLGYFFASLVDILIVFVFDDYLDCVPIQWRIGFIIGLIVLFWIVAKIIILITNWRVQDKKERGEDKYLPESIQEVIDDFDNIACDGLLICENYCQRYEQTTKEYLQDFYLYEIIHHLDKALAICDKICFGHSAYVSSKHDNLIDIYRMKNFLQFSQQIYDFLQLKIKNRELVDGLQGNINNLKIVLDRIKGKLNSL